MARILIIDDEAQFRSLVRSLLERYGYEVLEAEDGEKGIQVFQKQSADLIITDIVMPNKEGLETIMELKKNHPGVKIIAVSGGGRIGPESYLRLAERFGAARVFTKPFDLQDFLQAIKEILSV